MAIRYIVIILFTKKGIEKYIWNGP